MEKLELKHLAPYLPYGLKVIYRDLFSNRKRKALLTGLSKEEIETTYLRKIKGCSGDIISFKGNNNLQDLELKLILRPLSDLTKEIEHNGEKFVPLDYNAFKTDRNHLIDFQNKYAHYKSVKYGIIERLLEWHFDIFRLIEKGLAVNINTLKNV